GQVVDGRGRPLEPAEVGQPRPDQHADLAGGEVVALLAAERGLAAQQVEGGPRQADRLQTRRAAVLEQTDPHGPCPFVHPSPDIPSPGEGRSIAWRPQFLLAPFRTIRCVARRVVLPRRNTLELRPIPRRPGSAGPPEPSSTDGSGGTRTDARGCCPAHQ